MINIISQSILSERTRGPKKVVLNLIKGLERIGYPYAINKDLTSYKRLWIHDDVKALKHISRLPPDIKIIVGPNLFIDPPHIPRDLDLKNTLYIQPSQNVVDNWNRQNYDRSRLEVWPVGIDTDEYTPSQGPKNKVLVYVKHRSDAELEHVRSILEKKNITYEVVRYGTYTEERYKKIITDSRYALWLGSSESQGIALEEILSTDTPVLIINQKTKSGSSSAPYFDDRCGMILEDISSLETSLDIFEKNLPSFNPRAFILENLTLEMQARKFIELFEKNYGLSFESGVHEKALNQKDWVNNRWYYKIWYKLKERLKNLIR